MEVFSSIIIYHPSENPNVTYAILQSRNFFEDLGTFTLAGGLREVKRAQMAKEERAQQLANPKGKTPVHDIEMGDPGAEKARLLESEGAHLRKSQDQEYDSGGITGNSLEGEDTVILNRSLTSPTSESGFPGSDSPISEKARGKMRERRSLSVDNVNVLERAPLHIGRNGFVPTQEWVCQANLLVVEIMLTGK